MSDTLYLQLDQNIEVTNPHVYLQDIAALSMSDPKILNRLRVMPVIVLDAKKPGRYVMSVSDPDDSCRSPSYRNHKSYTVQTLPIHTAALPQKFPQEASCRIPVPL